MSYQEEDRSRLRRQSSKQAVALAMQGKWKEAIAVNWSLLELFPNDMEAHNRLGRAYMELGKYSQAEDAYKKTLAIDPYNMIANKNLRRLVHLKETEADSQQQFEKIEPQSFIKEVGKAGVVQLYRLAEAVMLARTVAGDKVQLKVEANNLIVTTAQGEYLGVVEPRIGQRLVHLINGGNRYSASIVSSNEDSMSVIIREVYQHPSQAGLLSFAPQGVVSTRTGLGDLVLRRELEQEESLTGEPGYTVVGGEEEEQLAEEPEDTEDEMNLDE